MTLSRSMNALVSRLRAIRTEVIRIAGEVGTYNGPWVNPDDMRKYNGLVRYTQGTATDGVSITGMAYSNTWNSTDQPSYTLIIKRDRPK